MNATEFQLKIHELLVQKRSLLVVAPTGLGKTFAATGDLLTDFQRVVYSVPLRALGDDVRRVVCGFQRDGQNINAVVHHGAAQESTLFGEEFVVTTYDQVVCGVPGLPLSLPLKSGHAVAGALMMSRLVLDEAHLAWGISKDALAILLAIVKSRTSFGLQTVVMTATMPDEVAQLLANNLGLELVRVGVGGEVVSDRGLKQRDENRRVTPTKLEINIPRGTKELDFTPLDDLLTQDDERRIYFANQVETLHKTYDRLINRGVPRERLLVLHNRMPRQWRQNVEEQVHQFFGSKGEVNDKILLTNQVAEAGLDISAPLVVSDAAPVDTLVQRAGRCARWFRSGITEGRFVVLDVVGVTRSKSNPDTRGLAKTYVLPYRIQMVEPALSAFPDTMLSWDVERQWVNDAWGGGQKEALPAVEHALRDTTFALNLFDRAAQEQRPGEIASAFREVLSIEVAIESGSSVYLDDRAPRDLNAMLERGELPDTSSISLGRAYSLLRDNPERAALIRYSSDEKRLELRYADRPLLGDVLLLPSSVAYLHPQKGLCFGDAADQLNAITQSEWRVPPQAAAYPAHGPRHRQTLFEHTQHVMEGAFERLSKSDSPYRQTLLQVLAHLEPQYEEPQREELADLIAQLSRVAVAFHDLGKAHVRWQERARMIDPLSPPDLIGRTLGTGGRIGVPHTPPGYNATLAAYRLLLGEEGFDTFAPMLRAVALASCRHHSSLFNPAKIESYTFDPHADTLGFIQEVLVEVGAPPQVLARADEILSASQTLPDTTEVPLLLPGDDLFPIYALVGRAILLSDREDAAGKSLEQR